MNNGNSEFLAALTQELIASRNNWYGRENHDFDRFGPYEPSTLDKTPGRLSGLFSGKAAVGSAVANEVSIQSMAAICDPVAELASCYDLLADEYSKAILVKVLAYRLLGQRKVKLPLNNASYWSQRERIQSLMKSSDTIRVDFPKLALNHLDLGEIGYPIELYFAPAGVMATFVLKQYEYGKRNPAIKAQAGDCVIDAGGCWGDTALYFAHTVGAAGKVYTFEFLPDNLNILEQNLQLNPQLSKRIEVIPKALWNTAGDVINYCAYGPGTSLIPSLQQSEHRALQVSTISIDDFASEHKSPRIDYIKMDIEGSELAALKGAERTIRASRPRLAISVYHSKDDFFSIPNYLRDLDLGYEFFLDHFTIYGEETVLFASAVS